MNCRVRKLVTTTFFALFAYPVLSQDNPHMICWSQVVSVPYSDTFSEGWATEFWKQYEDRYDLDGFTVVQNDSHMDALKGVVSGEVDMAIISPVEVFPESDLSGAFDMIENSGATVVDIWQPEQTETSEVRAMIVSPTVMGVLNRNWKHEINNFMSLGPSSRSVIPKN